MANTIVLMPVNLIDTPTAQVFFQRACEEKNTTGSIKNTVWMTQRRLISLGMFPMFLLILIGPALFGLVLGAQWTIAGVYAGLLAPYLLIDFIVSPLISILAILEKQALDLTFNLIVLISRSIALIIGGLLGNAFVAIILYSGVGVPFWIGMNIYLLRVSGYVSISFERLRKIFLYSFNYSHPLAGHADLISVNTHPPYYGGICLNCLLCNYHPA